MLAADIIHNGLIAQDVNGDFRVTPLDVLSLVNHLNSQRRGKAAGEGEVSSLATTVTTTDSSVRRMLDVNNDKTVTPLDVLSVINKINAGEGEPILAEVRLVAIDQNGTPLASRLVNGVTEYSVGVGQDFRLQTQILDRRGATAEGVFSGYVDIDYSNLDGSANEKVAALYGELQVVSLANVNGGSFTLRYGNQETGPISVATTGSGAINRTQTATNIRNAVGALPIVGGIENLRVSNFGSVNDAEFELSFINAKIRTNMPNPAVGNNSLTAPSGTPTLNLTASFDPSNAAVFFPALGFPVTTQPDIVNASGQPTQLAYTFNSGGSLRNLSTGNFQLDEIGGSLSFFEPFIVQDPSSFTSVFDVNFRAAFAGIVNFTTNIADGFSGIALLDSVTQEARNLPEDSIQFSAPIRINVVDRILANDDVYPVSGVFREDSGPFTLTNVTGNDIIRVGTSTGIRSVSNPGASVGTVNFTVGGSDIIFNPAPDFFGQAVFSYTIGNSLGDAAQANVTVNISPVNDPPIAITPSPRPTIAEDSLTPLTLSGSDIFLPGPSGESGTVTFQSAAVIAGEVGGTVQVVNGQLVFRPSQDFNGVVRIDAVGVDQGGLTSALTRVFIVVTPVNDAPVASTTIFNLSEDVNFSLAPASLFSPGPADEASQTITLSNASLAPGSTGGSVSIAANGRLFFAPTQDFFGDVRIIVTGTDNGTPALSTTGTFTLRIAPVNDAPTANPDTFTVVGFSGIEQELLVLANDSAGPANEPDSELRITRILNQTGNGTVRIAANGRSIFYLPADGQASGTDSFVYVITDSSDPTIALTASARVNINIVPPVLPFAVRDVRSIAEGSGPLTIDVLANDLIKAGAQRRLVSFTQPASGQGTVTLDTGTNPNSSDDRLIYTSPSADFFGEVVFSYTLLDTDPTSNPSTGQVTVTVTEVNDQPTVTKNQTASTVEDVVDFRIPGTTLLQGSSPGPLESGQQLNVTSARVLSGGGAVEIRNGDLFFTPARNRVGNVVVEFTATDNGTTNGQPDPLSDTGRVTISVAAVNDAPETGLDTATTPEDTPITVLASQILANDRPGPANAADELTNQQIRITAVRVVAGGGTASLSSGNIRYSPALNFNGVAVLEYTITDSELVATPGFVAASATGQLNITVTPVNDKPENFTASRTAFAGLATRIDLTAELAATSRGATNEASQTLRINRIVPGSSANGVAVLNSDGSVTFTANQGTSGIVSFQVETIDNGTTNGAADFKTGIGTINVQVAPFQPSRVNGVAWIDDDGDNSIDADERRLGGITVQLTGTSVAAGSGSITMTAITSSDGSYSFNMLPPGTFTVAYVQPTMTIDGPSANSVTRTVAVPGGTTIVANFSISGFDAQYNSILDNLAEGYYGQFPSVRGKGIDAILSADGTMAASVVRGGYAGVQFAEVSASADGRSVFVTLVGDDMSVRTASVPRGKFFVTRDAAGNMMVKILALPSDLSFNTVGSSQTAATQSRQYLNAVDSFFAQLS